MEIKKIAVFAGTFDPITIGHLDLIKRGLKSFNEIIVLVAINPNKKPYFNLSTRLNMIKAATKNMNNVKVDYTDGYVVDYAKAHHANYLLRGVRNEIDEKYEEALKKANEKLAPDIKTIILKADDKFKDVSSSNIIKKIKNEEDISSLLPYLNKR